MSFFIRVTIARLALYLFLLSLTFVALLALPEIRSSLSRPWSDRAGSGGFPDWVAGLKIISLLHHRSCPIEILFCVENVFVVEIATFGVLFADVINVFYSSLTVKMSKLASWWAGQGPSEQLRATNSKGAALFLLLNIKQYRKVS